MAFVFYLVRGEEMKRILVLAVVFGLATSASAQVTVFNDDFNRTPGPALGNSIVPNVAWTTTRVGGSGDSEIAAGVSPPDNYIRLFSNTSAGTAADGLLWSTNSHLAGHVALNSSEYIWSFNFRWEGSTALTNWDAGGFAMGYVLAGSDSALGTDGEGYAVTYDSQNGANRLRLVRYTTGLSGSGTQTTLIQSGNDVLGAGDTNNYASARVVWDRPTTTWSLFVRDDGAVDWDNPGNLAGYALVGSFVEAGFDSQLLRRTGFVLNYAANPLNQAAGWDNALASVPEPTTFALLGLLGAGAVGYRRYQARKQEINKLLGK